MKNCSLHKEINGTQNIQQQTMTIKPVERNSNSHLVIILIEQNQTNISHYSYRR